jgi:hypothetical protein
MTSLPDWWAKTLSERAAVSAGISKCIAAGFAAKPGRALIPMAQKNSKYATGRKTVGRKGVVMLGDD